MQSRCYPQKKKINNQLSKSKGTIQDIVNRNFWLPDNGRLTAFVNTGTWNGPNGSIEGGETFAAEIHYSDDAMTWKNLPVILTRIHGNPLDTLIWSQTDQGDFTTGNFTTGAGERITFVARITGKMDKSGVSLQTGTVKSLAGYHIELSPNDPEGPLYDASALTMPGNLIFLLLSVSGQRINNTSPAGGGQTGTGGITVLSD